MKVFEDWMIREGEVLIDLPADLVKQLIPLRECQKCEYHKSFENGKVLCDFP